MVVGMYVLMFLLNLLNISNLGAQGSENNNKVKIIFRCDDYLLQNSRLMDSILFIFQKNNIPVSLGIVPFNPKKELIYTLDEPRLSNLKSLIANEDIEISLHGFTHGLDIPFTDGYLVKRYRTEFKGVAYDEQYFRISTGKKVVDSILGVDVKTFVPPYNSYDNNTLKILEELNFEVISSDLNGSSASKKLLYMPETIDEVKLLKNILEKNKGNRAVIIFMFHPYAFKDCCPDFNYPFEKRVSYTEFDSLLAWVNRQNYIQAHTFNTLSKEEFFGTERLRANTDRFNLAISVAHRLNILDNDSYANNTDMKEKYIIYHVINVVLHFIIFLIVFFISRLITRLIGRKVFVLFVFFIVAVGFILIRYYFSPTWIMMIILSVICLLAAGSGIIKGLNFQLKYLSEPVSKKTAPNSFLK